jgi:hypothetical protein
MVGWWRRLEADIAAVDGAIEREHQAAIAAGKSWPPDRTPHSEPELAPEPESSPGFDSEADGKPSADDQAARLDGLLAQAAKAARRFAAEKADREVRAEYAARLEREACTEPERTLRAKTSYEAEIEL